MFLFYRHLHVLPFSTTKWHFSCVSCLLVEQACFQVYLTNLVSLVVVKNDREITDKFFLIYRDHSIICYDIGNVLRLFIFNITEVVCLNCQSL